MWLLLKQAAEDPKTPPSDEQLAVQLGGLAAAKRYKTLFRDYPEVKRGPGQSISDHDKALREAFERENAEAGEGPLPADRLPTQAPAGAKSRSWIRSPEELRAEQERERYSPPAASDLKGMPQRIPGQFTGTGLFGEKPIPGYEPPNPLPVRDPGSTLRPYRKPPPQQSHDEWLQDLAEKGIQLNPDGTRATPVPSPQAPRGHDIWGDLTTPEPQLPNRPPAVRGHDIWKDLVGSGGQQPLIERPAGYGGRHKAAIVVVAYVSNTLVGMHDTTATSGFDHWEVEQ